MPRLFLKLFGTFWLTTVLILSISIFVSFRLANDGSNEYIDSREADAMLRDILDASGIDGLREWLSDSDNFPAGQTIYVVDRERRELLGRSVPQTLNRRLDRIWRYVDRDDQDDQHTEGPSRSDTPHRSYTPVLTMADGTQLLAIPGPAPLPLFGVLSRGGTRWLVLALAAITSLASFWVLSRSLSGPANHIAKAVDRFASGDLSARAGTAGYSNDEIGEIARQFDRMAAELETEAKTRSELFRNVSHELRAPLARLQIAAELLERKPAEMPAQMERIRHEINVLDVLSGQVLSLTRADRSDSDAAEAPLATVISRVVSNAELEADAKGVRLDLSLASAIASVRGDEALLVSAFENVIRNAVQATPSGGTVSVVSAIRDGTCTVEVSDTGSGVPDSELERIFEPFYRLDTNRPGSGIGLAITARVLHQIGGRVSARNADGGGLVVALEIPLADGHGGAAG